VSSHLTVSDKSRPVTLTGDGKWHAFSIKDKDGKTKQSIKPEPGVYILFYQLLGKVLMVPSTRLEVRIQRYPVDPDDNGTAWDTIDTERGVTTTWMGTRGGKVEVFANGDYSRGIGIDYRFKGGKLECSQRILKFVAQQP
jgi:hypothetical protein